MNAVKHQPATPLPWHSNDRHVYSGGTDKTHDPDFAVTHSTSGRWYRAVRKPEDAAYIAHAANAYPKLVEALRDLTGESGDYRAAEALLRELGEAP